MKSTQKLQNYLHDTRSMEEILPEIPDLSLSNYLDYLLRKYATSKSEVLKKTTLQRNYGYQIMNGTKEGGRDKILQIALALKVSLEECNHLLDLSNNGNLYAKRKRDALLIYAINKHLSVFETNEILIKYNQSILD